MSKVLEMRTSSPAYLCAVRGKWKEPRNRVGTRLGWKLVLITTILSIICYDIFEWIQVIHDYFLHALCNRKPHVTPILHWFYKLKKGNYRKLPQPLLDTTPHSVTLRIWDNKTRNSNVWECKMAYLHCCFIVA